MNTIHTHPGQPQMQAEVILASSSDGLPNIYTIRLRYPRFIHAELMTHRVFSRNARSSRAVPIKRMIQEVCDTPVVPWHWGKNQKGMQAGEECNNTVRLPVYYTPCDAFENHEAWLHARDHAVDVAKGFMDAGYHKQIVNRLLEPFMWIDVLVTSTDWENFFWLRDHEDAEPHIQDLARLIRIAINTCNIQDLEPGDWHLPYINIQDKDHGNSVCGIRGSDVDSWLCKISAARCARISYAPFDGDASYERELQRYDSLVRSDRIHASPLEHQATPDIPTVFYRWESSDSHGNFQGWVQYRKTIPGERK